MSVFAAWFSISALAVSAAAPDGRPPENAIVAELPTVEAAALHTQTLEEAPARVTVITAEDIRQFGYHTLADVLDAVPGFYSTYDRIYHYFGVRGFLEPGDYNTRFLVMLNGHPLTDNIYNSNGLFGQDFGLDMDLVARIEVIRGPTSALYGSNGMLANINIVTKSPVDLGKLRVSLEAGSYGRKKAALASSLDLGGGANLLLAVSQFSSGGAALRFPQVSRETFEGLDGERGYHSFANLVWRDWSFAAFFNNRDKQVPVPWGEEALLFHRGNGTRDSRNFVSAAWTRAVSRAGRLRWRLTYDQYRYDDRFDFPLGVAVQDVRNAARGDWLSTELTYQFTAGASDFTVGGQLQFDIRSLQQDRVVAPEPWTGPRISHPDRRQALFAQDEWHAAPGWTMYGGLRVDHSARYGAFVSPRVAVVRELGSATVAKLVYGRPFRNPSAFEQYYCDSGHAFLASGGLQPESAHTFEVSVERRLRRGVSVSAGAYRYRVNDLISAAFLEDAVEQYRNSGQIRSTGGEAGFDAKLAGAVQAAASYACQNSGAGSGSPHHIAKLRAAVPLARGRLRLAAAFSYAGSQRTRGGDALRPVALADLTCTTARLRGGFELQFGVRNAAGWRHDQPTALALDRVPADGRQVFVRWVWHPVE